MALRNYITHPSDGSPQVAHVVGGALQVQEVNPQSAQGAPFSTRTGLAFIEVEDPNTPILSVRHAGSGSLSMLLRQLELYCDGRGVAVVDLVHGGTLTGAAFSAIPGSDFERDTSATAISGGTVIRSMYAGRDTVSRLLGDLSSALQIDSASPGPLSIVVSPSDGDVDVLGTLSWLETV